MSVKKQLVKRGLSALFGKHFSEEAVLGEKVDSVESIMQEMHAVFTRHDQVLKQLDNEHTSRVVDQIRHWQRRRLQKTYASLLEHPALGQAANFVLNDAYAGPNHEQLLIAVKRVISSSASKIFPLPLLRTAADILILNTLTYELDLALASTLIGQGFCGTKALSDSLYEEAFCRDPEFAARSNQLALLRRLGSSIDQYLGSQWVYAAFQLAQLPARKMGLGVLVDFMKPGFESMQNLPVPAENLLAIIVETESYCLSRLSSGDRQVYANVRLSKGFEVDSNQFQIVDQDSLAS